MNVTNQVIFTPEGVHIVDWFDVLIRFNGYGIHKQDGIITLSYDETVVLETNCEEFYQMFSNAVESRRLN